MALTKRDDLMAVMPGAPNPGSVSDKLYKLLADATAPPSPLSLNDLIRIQDGSILIIDAGHPISKKLIQ